MTSGVCTRNAMVSSGNARPKGFNQLNFEFIEFNFAESVLGPLGNTMKELYKERSTQVTENHLDVLSSK